MQGGSRHRCSLDPCLTMGNQLLLRVEDKLMALLGPSSPFVSSHCAPHRGLLSLHPPAVTGDNRTEMHHPKRSFLQGQSFEDLPNTRERWGRTENWASWKKQGGKPISPWGEVAGTLPGTSSSWCQHRARGCRVQRRGSTDQQTRGVVGELALKCQPIS